ncbi:hypothetical protein [Enterovibrio norvegicus]|uniref:hypothetical protein n=1 Tax=Enterovibrio norvegicus TaxID=188144 RepID=UPI00352EA830
MSDFIHKITLSLEYQEVIDTHRSRISRAMLLAITLFALSLELLTLLEFTLNADAYHFGSEVNGLRHESPWHYAGFSLVTLALLLASLFVERLLESKAWGFGLLWFLSRFFFSSLFKRLSRQSSR